MRGLIDKVFIANTSTLQTTKRLVDRIPSPTFTKPRPIMPKSQTQAKSSHYVPGVKKRHREAVIIVNRQLRAEGRKPYTKTKTKAEKDRIKEEGLNEEEKDVEKRLKKVEEELEERDREKLEGESASVPKLGACIDLSWQRRCTV